MTTKVVDIAKGAGFTFPASVVKEISSPALELVHEVGGKSELDKQELSGVVGGAASLTTSFSALSYDSQLKTTASVASNIKNVGSYDTVMCPW
jgi:hypothetical protein